MADMTIDVISTTIQISTTFLIHQYVTNIQDYNGIKLCKWIYISVIHKRVTLKDYINYDG